MYLLCVFVCVCDMYMKAWDIRGHYGNHVSGCILA